MWPVYEDYRLEPGYLVAVGDIARRYDPLKREDVLTEFRRLREGEDAPLVAFARSWGLLGCGAIDVPGPDTDDSVRQEDALGWIWSHVRQVRLVFELYHYLRSGNRDELRRVLDATPAWFPPPSERERVMLVWSLEFEGSQLRLALREPAEMAEDIIAGILNKNLRGVLHRVTTAPLRLVEYSPSLVVAIYWHLANVVAGGRLLRRCRECGDLFPVTDMRQRYCPAPYRSRGKGGSLCGAQARKRRQRHKKGG